MPTMAAWGAASVMASYNEIDGVPSHANPWLLNDVLRDEWGFDGAVVADYFAINELEGRHRIVENIGDAGALSLKSGVDLELPDGVAFYALKDRIEAGDYDIAYVDQAVGRVLDMKVRGTVFETPYADADYATERLAILPAGGAQTVAAFKPDYLAWKATLPQGAQALAYDFAFIESLLPGWQPKFYGYTRNFLVNPFSDRALIAGCLRLPVAERQANVYNDALLAHLAPELASIPFTPDLKRARLNAA